MSAIATQAQNPYELWQQKSSGIVRAAAEFFEPK